MNNPASTSSRGSDGSGDAAENIDAALAEMEANGPQQTDGAWLEHLIVRVAPLVRDWDVSESWRWVDWPHREEVMPDAPAADVGIDVVARRRSDGAWIAIQAKSRQLDAKGRGAPVSASELDKFFAASANKATWAERWLAVNGAVALSGYSPGKAAMSGGPVKVEDVWAALVRQRDAMTGDDDCEHCSDPGNPEALQSRGCMQNGAVQASVRLLQEHAQSDSGGLPFGQARGRIILPCGAGKTRVALRIVERLTPPRQVSVVLCPSIALVAQIRREFLQQAERPLRALAVCSDETAGYDPGREGSTARADDPTADNSNVSASEIKGMVTTDPERIAVWMADAKTGSALSVVFGTYQSARRIAEALKSPVAPELSVLVCDEAHRTAGLRRVQKADQQARIESFLLCHDQDAFPATYRVYQTATPRVYNTVNGTRRHAVKPGDLLVRSMDDETVFGVDLYRKTYVEAVKNGWLADYRIIALAVSDPQAYALANELARDAEAEGGSRLTSLDFLRGLAFAMAMSGATRAPDTESGVALSSAIGFLNTVKKSETMARYLQTDKVREWLNDRTGGEAVRFTLEHLDAKHNVAARDSAKRKLADASPEEPFGILNVGIFGEGTDSPTLSAVAFLESRKSPVDVVQAVGRAMRSAPDKKLGYIVVPVVIPLNADPETHLATSRPEEGWSELGQILLALRAHDTRIEDELADLMAVYAPPVQSELQLKSVTYVAVASEGKRIRYGIHTGSPGDAEKAAKQAAASDKPLSMFDIEPAHPDEWTPDTEPTRVVAAKATSDGSVEVRADAVARDKPTAGGLGRVNATKTRKAASSMINKGTGTPVKPRRTPSKHKTAHERDEAQAQTMLSQIGDLADSITVNLLARSGLTRNQVNRDLNILQESVAEASHHLNSDGLLPALDKHFGLDRLAADKRDKQADSCTIAALLLMNAAMLHQRIVDGGWMRGIEPLADIKNTANPVDRLEQNWERITRRDFLPVIEPAKEVIYAVKNTGRLAGLERALRHTASEAERIAATYADMGSDHAGPLFNKVMGNQASDGAYFTRPPAATMAARLALDACGEQDWTDPTTWRAHKTVDLACGSGTLLAALLTDMKRRARDQGADDAQLAALQKVAVEEVLKGMDINPVSLQLAATQLTAGTSDVKYSGMGLYRMPYGPTDDPMVPVAAGTLELLAEEDIIPPPPQPELFGRRATGKAVRMSLGDPVVEDAATAAMGARIAIMNPPFTNREKMGEKFPDSTQKLLRGRVDGLEGGLVEADSDMDGFVDKNALRPLFVGLVDRCLDTAGGVLSMIAPTVALTAPSGLQERRVLAERFDVHTILTCHQPGNINLSQNTNINESIVVLRRHGNAPPRHGSSLWTVSRPTTPRSPNCSRAWRSAVSACLRAVGAKLRIGRPSASRPETGQLRSGALRCSPKQPRCSLITGR